MVTPIICLIIIYKVSQMSYSNIINRVTSTSCATQTTDSPRLTRSKRHAMLPIYHSSIRRLWGCSSQEVCSLPTSGSWRTSTIRTTRTTGSSRLTLWWAVVVELSAICRLYWHTVKLILPCIVHIRHPSAYVIN